MSKYSSSQKIIPTLVVMAAGMSKRYTDSGAERMKQIDGVLRKDDPLWAFTVYNAVTHHGIRKIVPIIRHDFEEQYIDDFGAKMEEWAKAQGCKVAYAYQKPLEDITNDPRYKFRTKMWGTAECVVCAKQAVDEPFIILNGDDHYGLNTIGHLITFANSKDYQKNTRTFAMPGYLLENVLSPHGPVTRGVCQEKDGFLTKIIETMKIERQDDYAIDRDTGKKLSLQSLISMNMWLLDSSAFPLFEGGFAQFMGSTAAGYKRAEGNPELQAIFAKDEYLLPTYMNELVLAGSVKVKVVPTKDPWTGITHLKDRKDAANFIRERYAGEYPADLWAVD